MDLPALIRGENETARTATKGNAMSPSRPQTWVATLAVLVTGHVVAAPPTVSALAGAGRAAAGSECDGHPVTILGTDGADVLDGTPGPDVIAGLGGNDLIRGFGGDDVICGGNDADVLRGGPGNDRLFGEAGIEHSDGDEMSGGGGDDYLDGGGEYYNDHIRYRTEPAGIHVDLQTGVVTTSRGTDTIVWTTRTPGVFGSRHADVLDGSDSSDQLTGEGGDDTINGFGGNDNLVGGGGNDDMNGGLGLDVMYGQNGNDVLDSVDIGLDAILNGGRGDDHLIGTPG
jgi:Ca2+-binding RTX toxin-like protein